MKRALISALTLFSVIAPVDAAEATPTEVVHTPETTSFDFPPITGNYEAAGGLSATTAEDPCHTFWEGVLNNPSQGIGWLTSDTLGVRLPDPTTYEIREDVNLPSFDGGPMLNQWIPFNENLSSANRRRFEEGMKLGIDGYCHESFGAYLTTDEWSSEYVNNMEPSYSTIQSPAPFCGSRGAEYGEDCNNLQNTSIEQGVSFTGLGPESHIFVPQRAVLHVNAFNTLWSYNTSGYVNSRDENAAKIKSPSNWLRREFKCQYPFEGACPHDFLRDPGAGSCDVSEGSERWQGCVVQYAPNNVDLDILDDLCPARTPRTIEDREWHNGNAQDRGYSPIYVTERPDDADNPQKYFYSYDQEDRWFLAREGCTIARSEEAVPLHRNVFEYRKLSWFSCVEAQNPVHDRYREFIDAHCGSMAMVTMSVECKEFGDGQAHLTGIDLPANSSGDWSIATNHPSWDQNGRSDSGGWSTTVAENERQLGSLISLKDPGVRIDGELTVDGFADEEITTTGTSPDCDGTPKVAVQRCVDVDTVRARFTAVSDSSVNLAYRYGVDGEVFRSGSVGPYSQAQPYEGNFTLAEGRSSRFGSDIGTASASATVVNGTCRPVVELVCDYIPSTGRFTWGADITNKSLPADIGIYRNGTRIERRNLAAGENWSPSGEAATNTVISVRYVGSSTPIAEATLNLANCGQSADIEITSTPIDGCPASTEWLARITNTSVLDRDITFQVFENGELIFSGTIDNNWAMTAPRDGGKNGAVDIYVYDDNGALIASLSEPLPLGSEDCGDPPPPPCDPITEDCDPTSLRPSSDIMSVGGQNECDAGGNIITTVDPSTTITLNSGKELTTAFTITLNFADGTTETRTQTVTNATKAYMLRDLFGLADETYASAFSVEVSYDWDGRSWPKTATVNHTEAGETCPQPVPCDEDGDGRPDLTCTNGDALAEIIHDSWEYATVRDITSGNQVAWTHCESRFRSDSGETCNIDLVDGYEYWDASFLMAKINTVMIDLSQEIAAGDAMGLDSSNPDVFAIDMCDEREPNGRNREPGQRVAACEVLYMEELQERLTDGTMTGNILTGLNLSERAAVDGGYSEWRFQNGTLAQEIEVNGETVTSGYCWDIDALVGVTLTGNGGENYITFVDPAIIYNAHNEIGPFWQPTNGAAPHGTGCFAVWLPTPVANQ